MTRSSTTTRSDGTFSFESLAAGTYQITGYPSGSRRFHWPSGPFTINADSIVDLGVATDSSSLSIVGQVRTESLNQVATFPLMVSIRSEDGGRPLTSETDADGRFRFDDLRALSYAADVASPGYRSTSPVLIHAGAQDAEIIIARACGVIEITVVDERGLPFEDGLAEVLDQPGVLEQPRSAGPIRSGNYLSRPLPPGRYQIRLTATGRAPWIESRIVATEGVHIRAVLMPAPFLRRRLCEQDGEGIADAEVVLTRLDPHRFRGDLRCEQRHAAARTDSEGHFKIPIDRDDLILTFLRDGRPRWRGTLNDLWKIESGLDIHLPPAGQIRGQVSDASGRPVAGAGVRADPGGWTRTFGAPVVYTATDGRFLVECITPGRSNLSVLDRQGKVLKDTSAVARIDGAELAHIRLDFTSSDASGPIIVASENP